VASDQGKEFCNFFFAASQSKAGSFSIFKTHFSTDLGREKRINDVTLTKVDARANDVEVKRL
jgi:hypothetical protein